MLQKLYALLILLLLHTTTQAQFIKDVPEPQNTSYFGLNGQVMTVNEQTYKIAINGDIETEVDTLIPADTSHVLVSTKELGFDNKNQLKEHKYTTYNIKRGKVDEEKLTTYNYNSEHLLTSITTQNNGRIVDSAIIEYNSRNRLTDIILYDHKDRVIERRQFSYRDDKVFNIRIKDANNAMKNFIRLEYDQYGILREREMKGTSLEILATQLYTYDTLKNGNTHINIYDYELDNRFRKLYSSVYDTYNNEVQRTIADSNKRVIEYRTLTYNKQNEVIEEIAFTDVKLIVTYTYVYDSKGNWLKRTRFHNGIPYEIRKRTISYYTKSE